MVRQIKEARISKVDNKFVAKCIGCEKLVEFATKNGALKMLARGGCRNCKPHYTSVNNEDGDIYQNANGKWSSTCSGCLTEQAYTRKDYAKQSSLSDWQCKKCVSASKRYSNNMHVGDKTRVYNKFKKSANSRGLIFCLTEGEFYANYDGTCALTGWPIQLTYAKQTASADRIDNSKGYVLGNIHWVSVMVNMCRGKEDLEDFISMCIAVTANNSATD